MCQRKYPPSTMATPPRHEEYGKPAPTKVSPAVKALHKEAEAAFATGDYGTVKSKETQAMNLERNELASKGIAGLFSPVSVKKPMSGKGTRRNKTSGGDLVMCLLTIRNQVKLYHWQTKSFARHTATDALTSKLDESIDSFVESYMGRYGRPKVSGSIKLHNFSESAARAFVAAQTAYLTKVLPKKIGKDDSDLLNLRDEILAELTKVLYLFTLQ
jgi:hypothetical protein